MENYKIPKITNEELTKDADIKINEVDALYGKVIESSDSLPKEGYLAEQNNHNFDDKFEEEMDILFIEIRQMKQNLEIFQKELEQLHEEKSTTENDNMIHVQNKKINELNTKIDIKEKKIALLHEKHEKDFEEKMENMVKYN